MLLYSLIALLAFVPALFSGQRPGPVRWILANPVAVWIGLVSYGIYLWHEAWVVKFLDWTSTPANVAALLAFTIAVTVAVAALSRYLIERPVRNRGDRTWP